MMAVWLAKVRFNSRFLGTDGEAGDICVAHCPKRVLPGYVLRELVSDDRVIGGLTPKCSGHAKAL